MLDLRGAAMQADEREFLQHPLVGGVILFARNYQDPQQLSALTHEIHNLRQTPLLVAVDHEGGRVQRFRGDFSALPACHRYGEKYAADPKAAFALCEKAGWLLAAELLSVGVDLSFAPVLDLDKGLSQVIGDRALHSDPEVVAELARHLMNGMKRAGMMAVGKHFPGHGSVIEDSHHAVPVDERPYVDIAMSDCIPFERLINAGLPALMPAHVIYPEVDELPSGFSRRWLQEVLREQLGFQGAIFSDDISMAAAERLGDYQARAEAALEAGCDMVLICNNQPAAIEVLDTLQREINPASQVRLMRMHGMQAEDSLTALQQSEEWRRVADEIAAIETMPELGLGDDEIQT